MNCFRYLGFTSFDEVDRITIREYGLLMKAARLRQVDEHYKLHLGAWLTFAAKAQKRNGKPVYGKFERFFNYKKELEKVTNESKESRFKGIGKLLNKGE